MSAAAGKGVDGAAPTTVAAAPAITAVIGEPAGYETALPRVLKIVGSVVAPTTLLTALMYYFGRLEAAGFLWYLGAHVSVLDLTVQDYLNNSVDGLIPPLIAIAGATLLVLWGYQLLIGALPPRRRPLVWRALLPLAATGGVILLALAMCDFLLRPVFPASFLEGRGLSLSIGVLLLVYATHLVRRLRRERGPGEPAGRAGPATAAVVEWGAVFILVSVGLFWAVGSYAITVGTSRAQLLEATLAGRPDVVAYSEQRLGLQAPGVREVSCTIPEAAYRFRYDGLKLVQQSGNQYLLLPAGWTRTSGAAILLARSDKIRLEFSPAGQVRPASC